MSSLSTPHDDGLPYSLVMTSEPDGTVIGHARLMPVLGRPRAALIETVLVDPALRGYGLGRQVMEEAESSARGIGIQNIHLSTHDKQQFYAHLGYCRGPVVSPQRMCMASLKGHHVDFLPPHHESSDIGDKPIKTDPEAIPTPSLSPSSAMPPPALHPAPPPPAPPPPAPPVSDTGDSNKVTWMFKFID